MGKQLWKPGNMLYPLPVVLVSAASASGEKNVFTVAWTGTICSDPAMVSISVRPQRHSYQMIRETGEFVINLTTEKLAFATDYCAPLIAESPVNIECKVTSVQELGSHDMFLANVTAVHADEAYLDENGKFDLAKADPIVYSHGTYYTIGKQLGTFGYSVRKK